MRRVIPLMVIVVFAAATFASCGGTGKAGKTKPSGKTGKEKKTENVKEGGQGDSGKAAPETPAEGAESPEKAFEAFKPALEGQGTSCRKVMRFIVPEERKALAAFLYIDLTSDGELAPKLEPILGKYKLSVNPEGVSEEEKDEARESVQKLVAIAPRLIKDADVDALVADLESLRNKIYFQDPDRMKVKSLKDLESAGDSASGIADLGEDELKIEFRKVKGRWFVSVSYLLE